MVYRQTVGSVQERLSRAEVRCQHLEQERTLLRESEARLLAEHQVLQKERSSAAQLLANMEAIKASLEHAQNSGHAQLENQVRGSRRLSGVAGRVEGLWSGTRK